MSERTPGLGADNAQWVLPAGTAADDGFDLVVDSRHPGWRHTSLRVLTLGAGEVREVRLLGTEAVVVPLQGAPTVAVDGERFPMAGRASVFAGPTDVLYVPAGRALAVAAGDGPVRVALCGARSTRTDGPVVHLPAADVPLELRGAGQCSREVRNFGVPGVLDADRLIACEVITPGGNWSSYPPHKHDQERPGVETELEEIYYFELQVEAGAPAPEGASPVGYQRVYGTDGRPIDVLAEVGNGDVVLVPHGWHGPATAPPGYDLYYLNVMAGPGAERAWLICDDPAHGWVRATWDGQQVDPRLPIGKGQA